jgi:O-antigen/teichoic acid export membrane protein
MLGLYAPVLTLIGAMGIVPDSIGTYLYPKLSFQLGSDNDPKRIWKQSLKSHLALLALGIPLALAGYLFIPYVIDNYLPKYIRTKDIINLGLMAGVFFSFKFGYTILITLKSWAYMSLYIISFGLCQYVFPLAMLKYHDPLKAVVLGQMISFMAMYVISLAINYLATHKSHRSLAVQ